MNSTIKRLSIVVLAIFLLSTPMLSVAQDGENFKAFIQKTFETELNGISSQGTATKFLQAFNEDMIWVDIDHSKLYYGYLGYSTNSRN